MAHLYANNDEIVMGIADAMRSLQYSFFKDGDVVCLREDMLVLMDARCLEEV